MRFASLLLLLLAACARDDRVSAPAPPPASSAVPPGVKLGRPYTVFGRTYVPVDDRSYDEVGIASWYGPGFHALPTASGETYDQDGLTAAHKTLPMPSFVEVTNLHNGRRLVVRINDRGPFVEGRIIDVSRRAAQLLGMEGPGLARVRVRRVFPAGDWALTTAPLQARAAPAPVAAPLLPPPAGGERAVFVQVVALSDEGRAHFLVADLADIGPAAASRAPSGLWRVRLGPFTDPAAANRARAAAQARGFRDAMLVAG
ncbi:septal ring lytic transglycosylase RlpA family protein [Thermaurantiacus sp.]